MNLPELAFEQSAYSVDAVQRAAYRMSDRLSIDLHCDGATIRCRVHLSECDDALAVLGEFRNHVLDEVLRERIRTETEAVRNVILSLAFSETGLVVPD